MVQYDSGELSYAGPPHSNRFPYPIKQLFRVFGLNSPPICNPPETPGDKTPGDTPLFFCKRLGTLHFLLNSWTPPTKLAGKLRRAVRSSRFAGILGGRHDVGPSMVRNAGGVASNSLGCQPQGWVSAESLNPEGVTHIATFSNMPASLSPLQGLDFWLVSNQGLAPLAIPFRPSRA